LLIAGAPTLAQTLRVVQHNRRADEKFFVNFSYSRIDNTTLNSTLGIPETLQVEHLSARLKN
jgi:hypothetical protein